MPDAPDLRADLPAALAGCRDAEDYFDLLGVDYDERVLGAGRLHVLKLFGAELVELADRGADGDPGACRDALERAYRAVATSGPLAHRVFKVLRDRAPGQFVPDAEVLVEPADAVAGAGGGEGP